MSLNPSATAGAPLTAQEWRVMLLLASGHTPKASAQVMHISPATVHQYLNQMRIKFEVPTTWALLFEFGKRHARGEYA